MPIPGCSHLLEMDKKGKMVANSTPDTAPIRAKVNHTLPSEQVRFALNAARQPSSQCQPSLVEEERQQPMPLCGEKKIVIYMQNCCMLARDQFFIRPGMTFS